MSMYAQGGPLQRVSSYFSLPSLHGDRQPESFLIEFASHRLIVRWNWVTTKASSVCFGLFCLFCLVWFGLFCFVCLFVCLFWFGLFWFDLVCFVLFCLFVCLFCLFVCLLVCLFVCLLACLFLCLFVLGWVSTHQRKTNSDPNPRRLEGVTVDERKTRRKPRNFGFVML